MLNTSEQLFFSIFNSLSKVIIAIDDNNKVLALNNAAKHFFNIDNDKQYLNKSLIFFAEKCGKDAVAFFKNFIEKKIIFYKQPN